MRKIYSIGRKVYVKSLGVTGRISERNYIGSPRRAVYVVDFTHGKDFLTSSKDLRGADYLCDGCCEWRSGVPHGRDRVMLGDGTVDDEFAFCFLCCGPRRAEEQYYWQLEQENE